jgi:putative flippase GtrA
MTPARPTRQASAHRRPTSLLKQVGLARLLYARSWQLISELAKFGIVGGLAVVVADIGTNVLYFQAGFGPLISNVIATVVATAVSYVGNRYWTFRHHQRTNVSREGIVFFVLNGIGLAVQLSCLGFSTYVLGLHDRLSYNISLVIGIGLATLFRYGAYKKWVWPAQPATTPAAASSWVNDAGPDPWVADATSRATYSAR